MVGKLKKKLLIILLPILVSLLVGGGFCIYWFAIRKPSDEISVKYTLQHKSISVVNDLDNSTQLTVEYSGVKWNDITWKGYTNLPNDYQWDDFLKVEGLQNNPNASEIRQLTISFDLKDTPPANINSFLFWLTAQIHNKEFKSPEVECYFAQRDINALSNKSLSDFDSKPEAIDVVKAFFASNNINPQDDWDLDNWSQVNQQVTVILQAAGALISVLPNNPFFKGQAQVDFLYPSGTSINDVIENTTLGVFYKEPNQQDVRWTVESLNDEPTLGGWSNFWSQVVLSTPDNDVCYMVAFGNDYSGSLVVSYEVV